MDDSLLWMVGLILTHTISTMLVVLMLIGYVALNIKAILSNPKSILYLFLAMMMTFLLTAFYWAPMLEMMMADQYYYQIPWTHIYLNTLTNPMSSFYFNTQISLFPYGIELYALVIVLIGFVFKLKIIWTNPFLRFSLTMGILTLMIASNVLPISWFKFLDFMQFPWRFFMFVDYFFAILLGYTLSSLFKSKTTVIVSILFIFFVVIQYLSFSNYYIQVRMKDYLYEDFVRYDYNGKEFIPTSVYIPNLITNAAERVVQSSQTIDLSYTRRVEGYVLEFNQKGQINTVLEFPLIYYKGYSAYLSSEYGNRFLEISKTENGMILVNLEDVQSGSVHVFYNGTRLKNIAEISSLLTFFSLFIYLIVQFIKSKYESKLEVNV